ncbi:MAG: DUF6512 family protein [Candidatus Bathyarchaeota archaeon]|nr:DUF6512 family protein [Candidatus Bathyarchaeota archaeon]
MGESSISLEPRQKQNRIVLTCELIGIVIIIILGSLLHFTYEGSGGNLVVGVFSAVNESIWEHLKLAFWPTMLYALLEYLPVRRFVHNFVLAKTVAVYVMVSLIPAIFYTYTLVTGESILAIDIASFIVAVVVGQLISYKLLISRAFDRKLNWVALFFLVFLAVVFVVFTFVPPQAALFQDPLTGTYGVSQ